MLYTVYDEFLEKQMGMYSTITSLYHYTNAEALINIIENKTIRLTHINYLNDNKEFEDASSIIRTVIEENAKYVVSKEYLDTVKLYFNSYHNTGICIFSMTEKEDLLSQWRGYCHHGIGYCLKINPNQINNDPYGISIKKCIYDNDIKKEIIKNIIFYKDTQIQNKEKNIESAVAEANLLLLMAAPTFKDTSFAEEKEWRLITLPVNNNNDSWRFRSGKNSIIPYLEITLQNYSFLSSIMVGPTEKYLESINSIRLILSKNKAMNCDIKQSKIPMKII